MFNEDALGEPSVNIMGFKLWVQARELELNQGGSSETDWLCVTASCQTEGASVNLSGSIVLITDFAIWRSQCEELQAGKTNSAEFESCEPGLQITIGEADKLGHLLLRVEMSPDPYWQSHVMSFPIDQSYLPGLISQLRAIEREYPETPAD